MINIGLSFYLILEQLDTRLWGLNTHLLCSLSPNRSLGSVRERGSKGHIRQKEPHSQSETTAVFPKLSLSLEQGVPSPH